MAQSSKGEPASWRAMLKKPWIWLLGSVAGVALLLTNVNVILRQSRELPGEWGKTSQQFSAWYYEYVKWPGEWTSQPEGVVDQLDENLSPEGVKLDLELGAQGQLGGTIQTDGICNNIAYFGSALIEGEITGAHSAELVALNFVGGHRRRMATIRVTRNGDVMTLTPVDDPWRILPTSARILRAPPDLAEPEDLCAGKESKFVEEAIRSIRH